VELASKTPGRAASRLVLYDHLPADFACTELPLALELAPGTAAVQRYGVRRSRAATTRSARASCASVPLGLWRRRVFAGAPTRVKVYPNFQAVTRYALFATDHRLSQIGVLKRRRRGVGLEFQNLREYREGDAQRQVD
jgi:uncharacterized protein (DUF58 family)